MPFRESWIEDWGDYLESTGGDTAALAGKFSSRWESVMPASSPGGMDIPASAGGALELVPFENDWSPWLERFLLTETSNAQHHAECLIKAIKDAAESKPWNIGNIVFVRDVLALRRAAFASDEMQLMAADTIISVLTQLTGIGVNPDPEEYRYFKQMLGMVSRAMVTELYEEDYINTQVQFGLEMAGFGEFTLMQTLENGRKKALGIGDVADNISSDWDSLIERYQALADDLFMTVLDINGQAMQLGSIEGNRAAFLSLLNEFNTKSQLSSEDSDPFLNLQRMLDADFLRFSTLTSPSCADISRNAQHFVKCMSDAQNDSGFSSIRDELFDDLNIAIL